jgi:hypothetical protein
LEDSFNQLENWLLNSGIVNSSNNLPDPGAVHSFYDLKNNSFAFLYPEITGYFVDTMHFLYNIDKQEKYKLLAESSANWLIKIFKKYGGLVMGIENNNPTQNLSFSFDSGICCTSMLKCYELTNNKKFLDFGLTLLDWIDSGSIQNDGTILPFFDHDKQIFLESDQVWYKQKGCLNIKTCIPFFRYYKITNSLEHLELGKKICDSYVFFQRNDGSFLMHLNSDITNLHTQCYALEGLLYAFYVTKEKKYLIACEKSLDWCVNHMENDGSIRLWFGNRHKAKASYPIAQLIRLMILFDSYDKNSKYKKIISKLMNFLILFQAKNNNPRISGGFYEESTKSLFGWKKNSRINSWGSMFSLQAINWFDNYEKIDFESIHYIY